jgi:hypothetical protein
MSKDFLSVGEVAEMLDLPPRIVTNALYDGRLDAARCPIVGGRRLIPSGYVPEIRRILKHAKGEDAAAPASVVTAAAVPA